MRNLDDFFSEAIKTREIEPAPDTPLRKKVRKPGDVGKVDRLKQMADSDTVDMPDTAQRMRASGSKQQAADKILADMGWKGGDKPGTFTAKADPSRPDQYRRSVKALGKEHGFKYDDDVKTNAEIEPGEGKGQSPAARMAKADLTGKDAITSTDKDFDDIIQDAQRGEGGLRSVKVGDKEIKDSGYQQHGYQPSGVGMKGKKAVDSEMLDQLLGGILDPDKVGKTETGLEDQPNDEFTKVFQPTTRDVEAHSDEGERLGAEKYGRKYLTPEVREGQKKLRDALDGQDHKAVQELAFTHDAPDEAIDEFIDRLGQGRNLTDKGGPQDKKGKGEKGRSRNLITKLENFGLDAGRQKAAYGGELGEDGEEFRNKDGTYNFNDMKKKDKGLYHQAVYNRTRAIIQTYLKQGGVDAYAQHEGLRSPLDMDLEHIKSLTKGGLDHPNNWVMASSGLNRLRGNSDLGPQVDTRVDQSGITGPSGDKLGQDGSYKDKSHRDKTKDTFRSFRAANKRFDAEAFAAEMGGDPQAGRKEAQGIFNKDLYDHQTQEEIEEKRARAIENYGMTPEEALQIFPDKARLSGTPYGVDRDQYEKDHITNHKDQLLYRKGLGELSSQLTSKHGRNFTNDQAKAEPDGIEFMKQIKSLLSPEAAKRKEAEKFLDKLKGTKKKEVEPDFGDAF